MSFRTDLLNGSKCDHYLDMGAPPIQEWDPDAVQPVNEASCAGSDNDQCCVAHRARTGRAACGSSQRTCPRTRWPSFAVSQIVGTAVHTSRVAAVGNFNDDDWPDILIGNRLYLNVPEECIGATQVTIKKDETVTKKEGEWYHCENDGTHIIHNRCHFAGGAHPDPAYAALGASWPYVGNHKDKCPIGSDIKCEYHPFDGPKATQAPNSQQPTPTATSSCAKA